MEQEFQSFLLWLRGLGPDVLFVFATIIAVLIVNRSLVFLVRRTFLKNIQGTLLSLVRIGVWSLALLLVLSNLGYNVSSLIAGLGLGGLAFAMGAQELLGNFFGSLAILSDRAFKVGDQIRVSEVSGEVKEIGLRSTKIETKNKTIVIVPNKLMASSIVEKF